MEKENKENMQLAVFPPHRMARQPAVLSTSSSSSRLHIVMTNMIIYDDIRWTAYSNISNRDWQKSWYFDVHPNTNYLQLILLGILVQTILCEYVWHGMKWMWYVEALVMLAMRTLCKISIMCRLTCSKLLACNKHEIVLCRL